MGAIKYRLLGMSEKRANRPTSFPHKWSKRNLLFFERVPNVPGKTFAVFSAFYLFLSNGHFCPLALYGKTQQGGYIGDTPLYCATSNPYIFEQVGIFLNPDLDSAAATQPKVGLNEINERNFPRLLRL